jgi:hypothetical protein
MSKGISNSTLNILKNKTFKTSLNIFLQISVWFLLIMLYEEDFDLDFWELILTFFLFLFYYINCLNSIEFKMLNNILSGDDSVEKIKKIFESPINIEFESVFFHPNENHNQNLDPDQNEGIKEFIKNKYYSINPNLKLKKKSIKKLKYFHLRDTSGSLDIDNLSDNFNLIKINLYLKIEFFDDISELDYLTQKEQIIERGENLDKNFKFKEWISLKDFNEFIFINLDENLPLFFNKWFYLLFTLIPFIEIYKFYLNGKYNTHDFCIKKMISTRNYLDTHLLNSFFKYKDPKVIIKGKEFKFLTEDLIKKNENNYEKITDIELNFAMQKIKKLKENLKNYNSVEICEYNFHDKNEDKDNYLELNENEDINLDIEKNMCYRNIDNCIENEIHFNQKILEKENNKKNEHISTRDNSIHSNNILNIK